MLFTNAHGQNTNSKCHRSTEGREFWFGFMESRNYHTQHFVEITVTARETTNFQIYTGKNQTQFNGGYSVQANNSTRIQIPWEMVEATGSEQVQDKGIRLVSEKPVNVYALNWDANSADVAVIYPMESLGNEYFAICYEPHISESNGKYGNGRNSEFLVVAANDSTHVLIIPSKTTDKLVNAGDTIEVMLNKGEVYQVQSMNRNNLPGQGDLTGSYIFASKPVAFYSGSLSTTVPATSSVSAWDHLYEQIPPVYSWGMEYYTVPLKSREQDLYRIMAAQDQTTVYIDGMASFVLNRGQFKELVLYYNQPKRIFGDKPILVVQYSQSRSVDNNYTGGNGDPFMIVLSSATQSKNDVTFVAYNSDQIKKYFANVIALTEETGNLLLNGVSFQNQFTPYANSKYSWAQLTLDPGTYRLQNTNPERGFLAYVYGFGGVESYGYGVGFNLDLVLDLGESIDFHGDTLLLCHGDSRTLDAGPYFDTYTWNTGETTQKLKVTSGGKFSVKTKTSDGCELEDSILVYVSHPETELGTDREGCFPFTVQLDGGDGFEKYIWQNESGDTLSTSQIYEAGQTGSYRVTVSDKYNCVARDTMHLTVFPVPAVKLSGLQLVCGSKSGVIYAEISGTEDSIWREGSFKWETSQPDKLQFKDPQAASAGFEVSEWGKYDIRYTLTTIDGCIVTDVFTVGIYQVPTSDFVFTDDPHDKCKGYSREIFYSGNASENADFHWDYGGSKLMETIDWQRSRVSVGVFNSNPFISLYIEENGCHSDTTRKPIGANPDFSMNTVKSRGCDSATIHFSGQLKVQDALSFEWDFGDGTAVDNQQSPSHFYSKAGSYDVGLVITNQNTGCNVGFQVEDMVKIFTTPDAAISTDPSVCYGDTIPVVYTMNSDSSVCFWEFDGAEKTGTGNDSIRIRIEKPAATIRLQVDEYGCKSKWVTTEVKRKPVFNFVADPKEDCQPMQVQFQARSNDDFLEYTWMADSMNAFGATPVMTFTKPGKVTVTLATFSSETGCSDTLTKTDLIWVHPKPLAGFSVDYPVAMVGQSNLIFTNQSLLSENFTWDFGDGSVSVEKDPHHNFQEAGKFLVVLNGESAYGCKDTAMTEIEILPSDVFTPNAFRPDSEIPENRVFLPFTLGVDPAWYHLTIFNRWGEIVFESKNLEDKWDGTLKNGHDAPMGNYVWKADYNDIQGFRHQRKGQVVLVR